ncbi:hypothetical protein VTK73DRAFT_6472 [Phialemonium thermophilum]|uniref:Uncharacterized protein n=1 Tax=Phialemonium thermophilum TaxID=223376 RepID=A0ABR3WK49_9PEZI
MYNSLQYLSGGFVHWTASGQRPWAVRLHDTAQLAWQLPICMFALKHCLLAELERNIQCHWRMGALRIHWITAINQPTEFLRVELTWCWQPFNRIILLSFFSSLSHILLSRLIICSKQHISS